MRQSETMRAIGKRGISALQWIHNTPHTKAVWVNYGKADAFLELSNIDGARKRIGTKTYAKIRRFVQVSSRDGFMFRLNGEGLLALSEDSK